MERRGLPTAIGAISTPGDRFGAFIAEREAIRISRSLGDPWPWTDDEWLRRYRHCNIRREDDSVTIWLRDHWREPHADDVDVWFALAVARLVNDPATLKEVGYSVPWRREHFLEVIAARQRRGESVERRAYRIRANPKAPGTPKAVYIANDVLTPMWAARQRLRPRRRDTLDAFHARLIQCEGMGSFIAAQVVADMKYVPPLSEASDWWTFAASGPGSRAGLNRVLGRSVDEKWSEAQWRRETPATARGDCARTRAAGHRPTPCPRFSELSVRIRSIREASA